MHIYTPEETREWLKSQPKKKSSACVAILNADNQVLMVKATYKHEWTFPAGIVDEGESPKHAAIREVYEEVGVTLTPDEVEFYAVVYTAPDKNYPDRFNFVFRTRMKDGPVELTLQESEIAEARWVPLADMADLALGRKSYLVVQRLLLNDAPAGGYYEASGV